LTQDIDRYRTNSSLKTDEYDIKRRENDQLASRNHELEATIKSLRDANDLQKQLNIDNEVNKVELKRKQDDFDQVQRVRFRKQSFFSNISDIFSRCISQQNKKIKKQFIYSKYLFRFI
jgi:hypothetical protein